ncbi:GNAT family protein [Dactylosporangium sp. NPDC000244]|uniref:GNAT family N-acetyltransferase n=1 Tax=Dactylosporangium sp. NPDC000244 TaxID=3154365 RepID=UPI00331C6725
MDTPDVVLRPVTAADLWLLERQADDPETGGGFNWSGYRDIVATRRRFDENRLIGPDSGCLIVQLDGASSSNVAGTVHWSRNTYGVPIWACWTIGIQLLPEFRGRGAGTASQRMLAAYLFGTTPVERVEAYTDVENVAEQRALEKAGFTREGEIRASQFREGRWRSLYLYSMVRAEYAGDPRP